MNSKRINCEMRVAALIFSTLPIRTREDRDIVFSGKNLGHAQGVIGYASAIGSQRSADNNDVHCSRLF
jgi:hypothetical protein